MTNDNNINKDDIQNFENTRNIDSENDKTDLPRTKTSKDEDAEELQRIMDSIHDDDKIKDYEGPKSNVEDSYTNNIDIDSKETEDENDHNEEDEEDHNERSRKQIKIERKVNKAGKLILQINEYSSDIDFTDISMETNDAIYINLHDPEVIKEILIKIRFSDLSSVYLIPVFIFGLPIDYRPAIADLSDGVFPNINDAQLIRTSNLIESKLHQLKEIHEEKYEKKVLYKLIRYMYTRDYTLQPYIYPYSTQGYVYPFLEIHYRGDVLKDKRINQVLEIGEKAGLLKSSFIDKIHLCPQCHSGFHNFRELCPKCGSSNLRSEALIHHFVCANVGPERDYKKANLLICPKCNRELRHIGVDYDKPSIIFECNDCGEFFQDPVVKALCFNCKTQNNPSDLIPKDIKTYTITRYGIGIVKASLFHEEYSESKFPGCYSYNVYRELLGQEIKRVQSLNTQAICGSIHINIEKIENIAQEEIDNIFLIASKELSNSPVSLCHFEDIFTFLLPYKNMEEAKEIIEHITEEAKENIQENFIDLKFKIKNKIIDIKIDDIADELLNQLIIN